jgi:DNA-binding response OmpR family regulator
MATEATKLHIVIIEYDQDMADLLETVLRGEGYSVESHVAGPGEVASLRVSQPPSLIIVDVPGKNPEEESPLLDAVRVSPAFRTVPVLAIASQSVVADAAIASYNVKAALAKPFDLDDLFAKVREALGQPPALAAMPPTTPPEGILAEAESILARYSREATFRWVRRLQTTKPWSGRRELKLSGLLDSVPVLVEAVDAALTFGDVETIVRSHPDFSSRAGHHARLRKDQGFELTDLIHEYSMLREELWRILSEHLDHSVAPHDVLTLSSLINGTLDRAIEVAIPVWSPGSDAQ